MKRKRTERQTQRDRERYANDPEYRERVKAQRKAYYQANKERIKARSKQYRADNPRWQWGHNLKQYGITVDDWDAMIIAQSGLCAICKEQLIGRTAVDHDHKTGRVRGLLCQHCNTGLGHFRDDPARLHVALAYLARDV